VTLSYLAPYDRGVDMNNCAIEIIGLTKSYGDFQLRDINLRVEENSVVGLIGHNGAGKSTLIKSILGLVRRDSGDIYFRGALGSGGSHDARTFCGYVPESLTYYEWMTVGRLLKFISGYYQSWDDALSRQLLDKYDLDPSKEIKRLSKGMRAKLALIISLSHRPPLLLLDEPTAGLDPVMKYNFLQEVRQLMREGAAQAVIISSHILGEIEQVADRIVILKKGRVTFEESTSNLLRKWSKVTFVNSGRTQINLPEEIIVSRLNSGYQVVVVKNERTAEIIGLLESQGATGISLTSPNLHEVFVQVS
jgi:ABC-2 type transport system ATP-binding protein